MATTYDKTPEPSMLDALQHLTREDGPHIRLSQATITIISAMGEVDEETGEAAAAFTSKGQELVWKREINATKLRAQGMADVTIYIDAGKWKSFKTETRIAEMDKALATVDVTTKNGAIARDDQDRPKLTTRHPDKVIEIFSDVVDRNGTASTDIQAIQSVIAANGQLFIPGVMKAANSQPEGRPPMLN